MTKGSIAVLDIGGRTDVGLKRNHNEDSFRIYVPPPAEDDPTWAAFFMVADGMGGLGGGDHASKIAVDVFADQFYAAENLGAELPKRLYMALEAANQRIREEAPRLNLARIGSTAAGLILAADESTLIFNVGDCRVYRIRGGQIRRLSKDQSILEARIQMGMSYEDAIKSENSSLVTAFLGQPTAIQPQVWQDVANREDVYVICSDGLWNLVDEHEIMRAVSHHTADEAAKELIDLALKRGGHDNITVEIIRLGPAPRRKVLGIF